MSEPNHNAKNTPDASDEHIRKIIGARRRNNIYGEISDYVMMSFLALGGTAGMYNLAETDACPITIYGRSDTYMYIIKILYQPPVYDSPEYKDFFEKMHEIASHLDAAPLVGVANAAGKRVKYYTLDGSKVRYLK